MITIQGQYATARVMIDEIDADTRRQIYHILAAPDAYKPMHLIRSTIAPAVDIHEVLPEIYNLKGR